MAYYNSTITFGGEILYIRQLRARKVPATLKQVVGRNIIKIKTAARNLWDWELTITGTIFQSTRETDRDNLEALQDGTPYALADGSHDGDYFITELSFNDDESSASQIFNYTLTIIQSQQPT